MDTRTAVGGNDVARTRCGAANHDSSTFRPNAALVVAQRVPPSLVDANKISLHCRRTDAENAVAVVAGNYVSRGWGESANETGARGARLNAVPSIWQCRCPGRISADKITFHHDTGSPKQADPIAGASVNYQPADGTVAGSDVKPNALTVSIYLDQENGVVVIWQSIG